MDDLLKILNEQQQRAVATPNGPTMVLAGPGSGKTRVLTYRIAYLIGAMNVPAWHILAVTFTNKAAREMGDRVNKILGSNAEGIWLGTFHSVCGKILRREADLLPVTRDFVIFDQDDQTTLLKEIIKENNLDEKMYRPASYLNEISRAKNDLISPENYPIKDFRDEQTKRLYRIYQERLIKNNAMDFDDMLVYTTQLLNEYPIVRETYSHKFEHILVDEFQDTNMAQYMIIKNLASLHQNLYLVGDEDQSIYRWRGADYRNIERFKRDFKNAKVYLLEQNYRSTQTILDSAMAVIEPNKNRTHKQLETVRSKGEKITMIVAEDDRDEADSVVRAIRDGIITKRQNPSDFAIMYRTNAQSRLFEEAFRREGINYRLVGAQRFYGRREIKDMLAFMRLVHNPLDEISLRRCINLPPRGIGAKTQESLQAQATASGLSMGEVLLDLAQGRADLLAAMGREGAKLAVFGEMLLNWRETAQHNSLILLFDRIVVDTGYEAYIRDKSEEGQDRWENLLELRSVVLEYEDQSLAEFLEAMALVSDADTLPETVDAPTMLTLHAAKGLEFENVFIVGLDENILPHRRATDDEEELAEERRLLYVGITRAKSKLTLSRARRRRSPYGSYEDTLASRFLDDIPEAYLSGSPRGLPSRFNYDTGVGFGRSSGYGSAYGSGYGSGYESGYGSGTSRGRSGVSRWENPAWMQSKNIPKEPPKTRYKAGQQVRHATYGRGVVKSSKVEFGDETVEVYFEGHGLKALVASMAKLELLQ